MPSILTKKPYYNDWCLFVLSYKVLNDGVAYDPPKVEAPKVEKPKAQPAAPVVEREGPSKKELNKLARKEKRANYGKDESSPTEAVEAPATAAPIAATPSPSKPAPTPVATKTSVPPKGPLSTTSSLGGIYFNPKVSTPEVSRIVASLLKQSIPFLASPVPNTDKAAIQTSQHAHLPYLSPPTTQFKSPHIGASSISGDANIARYLIRSTTATSTAASVAEYTGLYNTQDAWLSSEIDQWLDVYTALYTSDTTTIESKLLPLLTQHISDKTYAVGSTLSLADIALYVLLKRVSTTTLATSPHVLRYYKLIESTLPAPAAISTTTNGASKAASTGAGAVASSSSNVATTTTTNADATTAVDREEEGGTCPALEDAVEGQVCTRFPPEPSGYLHIGHAKAVLLNQYYAQRYKVTTPPPHSTPLPHTIYSQSSTIQHPLLTIIRNR